MCKGLGNWHARHCLIRNRIWGGYSYARAETLAHAYTKDSVFTTPWGRIVSAAETIAQSHQEFAAGIERDVELPLRNFVSKNREMQAMTTIQGNLGSMAKELEDAQEKADKLNRKGGKASASKVEVATSKVEMARSQWYSQAPFVFEKLQAVDETRLNHLRDVLTQYQTHETDQVERSRVNAEQTLNALLEVDTTQEIRTFVNNTTRGKAIVEPRARAPANVASTGHHPAPASPALAPDNASEHSGFNDGSSGMSISCFWS